MGLQEGAAAALMNTLKWMCTAVFLLFRYIIIPATRHGIKYGWIFPVLGIFVAFVIHITLYDNIYSFNHYVSIPIYVALLAGGIALMVWKLRRDKGISTVHTNPSAPYKLRERE